MSTMRTLGLAIGIAFAASTFAFAQQDNNPAANAAASGGSGTHQTSQKTGSAANTQKVMGNQQGYRGVGRTAARRGRGLYASMGHCRLIHHPGTGRLMRVCHWR
jgi:hypothetical protein